jgi:hypothetical protein
LPLSLVICRLRHKSRPMPSRRGHRATPSMDLVGHTPGRMDRRTQWADADLLLALDGYEEELSRAALSPITVQSYVNYGRRFLRWRIGDYVPRGMPMPAQRPVPAGNRFNTRRSKLMVKEEPSR